MEFSRQEYWSGQLFPSPGDLSDSGIEPRSPALAGRFFTTKPPGKPSTEYRVGIQQIKQFSCSIAQLCPTLCNPMNCSMPGFPVLHQLPELPWCSSGQWCHRIISSSLVPFSSCLQSFPASGSFPWWSQFFALGGQSIGVSASASVLPMNIQDWFPLGWTGWISLQSKGLSLLPLFLKSPFPVPLAPPPTAAFLSLPLQQNAPERSPFTLSTSSSPFSPEPV